MTRRARWALPLVALGASAAVAGCGTTRATSAARERPEAAMTAALPTAREVPKGWLPAERQRVLEGIRPTDPDCARLLRLADADGDRGPRGLRNAPQAHAVYYLPDPGATLAARVFRLPPGDAAARLAEARAAIAGCPRLGMEVGDDREVRLRRVRPPRPGRLLPDQVGVRYLHGSGGRRAGLDVLVARAGDDLLVVAAPGAFGGGGARLIERAEARALRKLRAAHRRGAAAPTAPAP
ncbi:hypothetical protein ACFQU9_27075 [Actinomadura namibiensis]|uniref:PknH-like extracellular domain-containing protein n=1 Tax=Actinomadura namibiensis TaxID=182080 RepID=A0A7W3LKB1_ACTNM|nr:hypothetical protein [Actinomadura namibiensis]MBA8949713.1 hypothetical protein [Actinomadura namibiensis]